MSNWNDPLTKDIIIEQLQYYCSKAGSGLWGIFMNDRPIYLTKVRVYKNQGRARSELNRVFGYRLGNDGKRIDKRILIQMIDELIADGILAIKQI